VPDPVRSGARYVLLQWSGKRGAGGGEPPPLPPPLPAAAMRSSAPLRMAALLGCRGSVEQANE
jgi:hypothetical protein